ncbi:MAG: OmpA family protein, partial [Verrucomicrobia bacterium]|nr:OmpA family protein [Deltaproteobacteria bacterium]
NPRYNDEVKQVGEYMKKYLTTTAVIEGHTDNIGGSELNMRLSQQRAENVVKALVDNFGIDPARLTAKGYGSSRRIAYNNTSEGRQKNRRINAVIDCVLKK